MNFFEMLGIEAKIKAAEKEAPDERYARIDFDLGAAENVGKNIEKVIDGDFMQKIKYDGSATGCYFKFDGKRANKIYAAEFKLRHTPFIPFKKLYLTNPVAQDGKHFIIFVGGAFNGLIESSTGTKVGVTDVDGVDITPANDKRYIAHAGGHLRTALATADTAKKLSAASLKVKWAIIHVESYDCRWGFSSTVHRTGLIGIPVTKGGYITVEYCDLTEIYFINKTAGAGELPVINVEYVKEA